MCKLALILLGAWVLASPVLAQRTERTGSRVAITPRVEPRTAAALRADVKLVLIPVTVTDPFGAPYLGLKQNSFRLMENGVEQQVRYFSTEEAPISIGVVFDSSKSMEDKLQQSREAVARFLESANPADEFFLVEFSDAPRILSRFTRDAAYIESSLFGIKPENWTALLDAVYLSMRQMRHATHSRRALLILSDGGDNHSRYSESEIRSAVREGDTVIYSIAFTSRVSLNNHARLLKELSDETGGLSVKVQKPSELPEAIGRISDAIRNQYVLGYVSSHPDNGLYRKIQVKVDPPLDAPRLRPAWRNGYFAPE